MTKPTDFSYEGKDLETMSGATNYYRWMLGIFQPYLGKKLVEVGAGSGTFSKMLADTTASSLTLLEPSDEMFPLLKDQAKQLKKQLPVNVYNDFLGNVAADIKKKHRPDTVIYINVMEHVEDDAAELKTVYNLLPDGGRLIIFVPALQGLMSDFDKKIGHYRRYSKTGLEQKVRKAGFNVATARYFDFIGIAPWWLKFTLMKSTVMQPGLTKVYDKFVVPVVSKLEGVITPPVGKNVLLVAEKTKN
jgi:SAM-dependent methyltransferase